LNAKLQQLRDGVASHIAEEPTVITPMRQSLVDDGYGGTMPSGTAEAQPKARVRIQHEKGAVQGNNVGPSGLDTNLSLYILTDHRAPLLEGDTFAWDGFTWTVGPVNAFRQFGGTYKTEAPLYKGSAVAVTIPQDFAAAAKSSTSIEVSWSDVGAVNTYSIERRLGAGAYLGIATPLAGAVSFLDTGLTPSTTYTYRMRAHNGSAWSAYTTEKTATTEAGS
jgi:hypothetical protein